ncbi:MAG: SAM hydroxide adenosyltransferase, partial [Anaerolineae bacterium]
TSIGRLLWRGDELSLEPVFQAGSGPTAGFQAGRALVVVGGREIRGLQCTYATVAPGEVLALVGSEGHLEIAVREGSGADRLDLQPGDPVELHW